MERLALYLALLRISSNSTTGHPLAVFSVLQIACLLLPTATAGDALLPDRMLDVRSRKQLAAINTSYEYLFAGVKPTQGVRHYRLKAQIRKLRGEIDMQGSSFELA